MFLGVDVSGRRGLDVVALDERRSLTGPPQARVPVDTSALRPVPAVWCGDDKARARVLARLEHMVLRTVDSGEAFAGRHLDATRLGTLAARIEARPELWVACEEVEASTTPLVHDGAVAPGRLGLRGFVVADGDGYCVLPAGLARAVLDGTDGTLAVRKDAWVLAEDRHRLSAPVLTLGQVDLALSLPSRNAEALYWIGRHSEAAETAIRLVQTIAWELDETPELATEVGVGWVAAFRRCLAWTAENPKTAAEAESAGFPGTVGTADGVAMNEALRRALVDETLPRSLVSSLSELLGASLSARELLSTHTCSGQRPASRS